MRIFIIISYCISTTAFGMHYNDSYFENYFSKVMTSIAKNQKSCIPNPNAARTWTNPVEALTALGMLQDKDIEEKDTKEHFYIKSPTKPSINQTPEWYTYINWNQLENDQSFSLTKNLETQLNKIEEDIQVKPEPISNTQIYALDTDIKYPTKPSIKQPLEWYINQNPLENDQTFSLTKDIETQLNKIEEDIRERPKQISNSQASSSNTNQLVNESTATNLNICENSLKRLKTVSLKTSCFTRAYYQRIFSNLSSSTISRDIMFGKRLNIIKKLKSKRNVTVFTFITKNQKKLYQKP